MRGRRGRSSPDVNAGLDTERNVRYFPRMARRAGATAVRTKEQLLEAAARVFAEQGYDRARLSEIARAAGLTTGAIYAHYENKAHLLTEAVRSHGHEELDALSSLAKDGRPTSILDIIARLGAELPRRAKRRSALVTEAVVAGRRDPEVRNALRTHLAEHEANMIALVEAAQASGEIDGALSPPDLVRLLTLVVLGSLAAAAVGLPATDPDDWSTVIGRLIDSVKPAKTHGVHR
jgi:AcrR family transcriptional regulator